MTTRNVNTGFVIFILVLSLVVFMASLFLISGLENFMGRPGVFDLYDLKNLNVSMLFCSSLVLFVMSIWTLLKLKQKMKSRRRPKLVLSLAILSITVFVFFLVYGLITKIWWVGGPRLIYLESLRIFNVTLLLVLGLVESIILLAAYIKLKFLSVLESIISSDISVSGLPKYMHFYEADYERIISFAKFMALSNLAIQLVVNVLATVF